MLDCILQSIRKNTPLLDIFQSADIYSCCFGKTGTLILPRKDKIMKTFNFCKQSVSRDNTVKQGRMYPVKVEEDNSVPLRLVNALRIVGFGLQPLVEGQGQDGKDVSGAGVSSPSQIIYKDGKFIAVPYSTEYVRQGSSGGGSECYFKVADWMASHTKLLGKPIKGQPAPVAPDPITSYDKRVFSHIIGRLKIHSGRSDKPLVINLAGVEGFGDTQMADLEMANDLIGCSVEFTLEEEETQENE
jgi:hypothetical protein